MNRCNNSYIKERISGEILIAELQIFLSFSYSASKLSQYLRVKNS